MKLKKQSVETLFLFCLLQTVVWASNVGLPKSRSLADAVEAHDGGDGSFELGMATTSIREDHFLPKEISRLATSFAKLGNAASENEVNACSLGAEVLAQMVKPTASLWLVDDNTMELLHNDLQLLIECTRPHDQVIFLNKKIISLARTVNIVHKLELIGTRTSVQGAEPCSGEVTSFTCPKSGPAFSVSATTFMAKSLRITNCTRPSRDAVIVLGENSNSTLYGISINNNANRAIFVGSKASLLLIEANLEKNEVNNHGAAVYVDSHSHISILNSNFKGNAATNGKCGGAVYFFQDNVAFIKGCTFADNTCEDDGGALALDHNNVLSIQGSTFTHNSAQDCAGVIAANRNCTFNILRSIFAKNSCGRFGGALSFDYEMDVNIQESNFSSNTAPSLGGAIKIYSGSKLSIKASLFTNNTSNGEGGAIWLYQQSSLSIIRSTFTNNSCGTFGGAVHAIKKCILIVQTSTISNNVARASAGGGIYLYVNNTLTAISSAIINNTAPYGGALLLYKSNELGIQGCSLNDNTAKKYGGALYFAYDNMGAIFDSSLSNNHAGNASEPYGEAIYLQDDSNSLLLLNSDITRKENGKTVVTYRSLTKDALSADVYKRYSVLEGLQWQRKHKNAD